MDISIVATSGASASVEVPEDVAKDLADVYETLNKLSNRNQAVIDFPDVEQARLFVRQGRAWAAEAGLSFQRRGSVTDNPKRVEFRIVVPRPPKDA